MNITPKSDGIRLVCHFNAEDTLQLQLIQAEYLAIRQPMDLQDIVTEIVRKFFSDRHLAMQHKAAPYAPYRAGDQVVLAIDPAQSCFVVEDQHNCHVRVQRPNRPTQEDLRVEDVKPISMRKQP